MALNARKQQNKSQESEKIIAKKLNASHNYKLMEEFLHKKIYKYSQGLEMKLIQYFHAQY